MPEQRGRATTATGQATPSWAISATAAPPPRPTIAPNDRSKSCITRTTVRPAAIDERRRGGVEDRLGVLPVGNVSGRARLKARIITTNAMSTP